MVQIELHKKIESFLASSIENADASVAKQLIAENDDAKKYFFSKADESWLAWLWKNGFFSSLNQKAADLSSYSYTMPELDYLTRMAEKDPETVAQIIDSIKITEANFNPEVVDRFLRTIYNLPVEQIKNLTKKIRDEKWLYLMRNFRKSGFEFDDIVEKLRKANEFGFLLELAQALLTVKNKKDIEGLQFDPDELFCVSDLRASGIFSAVAAIDENHLEGALEIAATVMADIVKLADKTSGDEEGLFEYADLFSFYDVDFFTLEIGEQPGTSYRGDVKNVAALVKELFLRATKEKSDSEIKRIFRFINAIPLCRVTWRLRIFALAQYPSVFAEELKDVFFKLFEVDNYYLIEGGAEYKMALKKCFNVLSEENQQEYVKQVFRYFSSKANKNPEQEWHKRNAVEILRCINPLVKFTKEDKDRALDEFEGDVDIDFKPQSRVIQPVGGPITHKSPFEITSLSVTIIALHLKSVWTPKEISKQHKQDNLGDDFLNPKDAVGLGDQLKADFKNRTDQYLGHINDFFDVRAIHPYYVYSLLWAMAEMARGGHEFSLPQLEKIIGFFKLFAAEKSFPSADNLEDGDERLFTNWTTAHSSLAEALLSFLRVLATREILLKQYRTDVLEIVSYLLTIQESPSVEEEKPDSSDPHMVAINSVRGRAYESFIALIESDGDSLLEDTREKFKEVLNEKSLAMRFVIGLYLPSVYFRDESFVAGLFGNIFPKDDKTQKDIYLATWEGYLSGPLYKKLFEALREYFSHAISLDSENYTKRRYSKDLDEALGIHMALAFVHMDLKTDNPLFVEFWAKKNAARHREFIDFIGRRYLSGNHADRGMPAGGKVSKEKYMELWTWILDHAPESESLDGFGFWASSNVLDDKTIIENMAKTLELSGGKIEYDYTLVERLPDFASVDPEGALKIIRNYWLDQDENISEARRNSYFVQDEMKMALTTIYEKGDESLKQKAKSLVNILVEKGSSPFWPLKEAVGE